MSSTRGFGGEARPGHDVLPTNPLPTRCPPGRDPACHAALRGERRIGDEGVIVPLSRDPEARRRQLENLKPAPPAPAGNARALVHGGHSERILRDVDGEVRELLDALAEAAPIRDADGSLPAADTVAVERAARLLRRYRRLEAWLDLHGELEERTGNVKPAALLADQVGRSLDRVLEALGMTARSRMALGLDVARASQFDLAQHWAMQDAAAERAAPADVDSTVEDPNG